MSRVIPQRCHGHVDTANSTSTPLGISAGFVGGWTNILEFGIIYISVYADQASAADGLLIEQSSDGVNVDGNDVFSIPATSGKNFSINPYAKYLRVSYTNGTVAQTEFRLQTILKQGGKPSSHRIQDNIVSDDDAELVKAVITGQSPFGTFLNVGVTKKSNLKVAIAQFGDSPVIDAFSRLRTSSPFTIVDSKQLHDKQPLFYDESLGGSATSTHNSTNADVEMAVTASSSDFVIRQTKQRFNYQPGKSQLIYFTFRAPDAAGVTMRVGLFSGTGTNNLTPLNGIWFENDGGTLSWNIAKNGSTTESVTQSNWNEDPMDGTGPSGFTLDTDACQIGLVDIEWLGVGRVRCGVVINGVPHYCHYFYHSNDPSFTSVYMSSPNLPVRYDIQSDGTSAGQLDHICSTVISEGGVEFTGVLRSVNMGTTHIDANTAGTTYAMIGIRLKAAYLDISVLPEYFSILSITNDNYLWSLSLNPTVAGTFTYADITDSACQYAIGATANTVTGGLSIDSGYGSQQIIIDHRFITSLRPGSTIGGTMDELVLCVTPLSANADYLGSFTFRELL